DGEDAGVQQRKIRARVSRHLEGADVPRVAGFLGEIVGVPFPDDDDVPLRTARRDPTLMGDQTSRAFEDFVFAETRQGPLCLVL
ncbi:hypothetical protein, partial [Propionibacterium freudenreichii]|uniref:hypothetical protein n=1 Tax=Propionibacterium freudenreichii TaxID=1744 RepID=UPI003851D870